MNFASNLELQSGVADLAGLIFGAEYNDFQYPRKRLDWKLH